MTHPVVKFLLGGLVAAGAAGAGVALGLADGPTVLSAKEPPPRLKPMPPRAVLASQEEDLALWTAAFGPPPPPAPTMIEQTPPPWRLVGIVGEGPAFRAVFASPTDSAMTVMAKRGETLPDGRRVLAVGASHVRIGFPAGLVASGAKPPTLDLFTGADPNAVYAASAAPPPPGVISPTGATATALPPQDRPWRPGDIYP